MVPVTASDSPCIGVCRMDPNGEHCLGCGRTLDEIAAWPTLRRAARERLLEEVRLRMPLTREMPFGDAGNE